MSEEPVPPQVPEARVRFRPGYVAAVAFGAVGNAVFFWFLASRMLEGPNPAPWLPAVSVVFGIFIAGGANLSALALARALKRRETIDAVLLFILIEMALLAALAVIAPRVGELFTPGFLAPLFL